MADRDPRELARIRRTLAAARRNRTSILPKSFTGRARAVHAQYVRDVFEGKIPYPPAGSLEAKSLAREASYARWHKADPRYEAAFDQYWYHDETPPEGPDQEDIDPDAYEDEDE